MDIRAHVFQMIEDERKAQEAKWGTQEHAPARWILILLEEIGEASQAFLQGKFDDARYELIQAAAVIVAWIEYLFDMNVMLRGGNE